MGYSSPVGTLRGKDCWFSTEMGNGASSVNPAKARHWLPAIGHPVPRARVLHRIWQESNGFKNRGYQKPRIAGMWPHEPKGSRIDFVSLDPSSNENFSPILSTSKITSFTTSPNENLLAIGDENGTLGVWFAAPSLDRGARELFTLPGHRGASIGQVSFSDDGNAILSSDINRKSILWKSVK